MSPPNSEQPEREHVQAREGDVGRADLQRHDHVGEPGEQRGREQQQHDRAVHREQLVVLLLAEELQARLRELGADHQRHDAAEQEEHERGDQVHVADHLVVGGGDPLDQRAAELAARGVRRDHAVGVGRGDDRPVVEQRHWLLPAVPDVSIRPVLPPALPVVMMRPVWRLPLWPAALSCGDVRVVVGTRHDVDAEEHLRVVGAAELGALAGEDADLVRGQLEGVLPSRDDVHLEQELRDPERVDDVGRGEVEPHPLVDREPELGGLGRRPGLVGAVVLVVEAPVPLEPDDAARCSSRRA